MRSLGLVGVLLVATTSFAATVPQLVLNHDKQETTRQHAIVGVNEAIADAHPHGHGHGVLETNQTIYQYLSQQMRYVCCGLLTIRHQGTDARSIQVYETGQVDRLG